MYQYYLFRYLKVLKNTVMIVPLPEQEVEKSGNNWKPDLSINKLIAVVGSQY